MIAGQNYNLVLAYRELGALENYLYDQGKNLAQELHPASFGSANGDGVVLYFPTKLERDRVWRLVANAMIEEDEED